MYICNFTSTTMNFHPAQVMLDFLRNGNVPSMLPGDTVTHDSRYHQESFPLPELTEHLEQYYTYECIEGQFKSEQIFKILTVKT